MKELSNQVLGGELQPADFNGFAAESENVITGAGQSLSDSDFTQLAKGISVYAGGGDYYTDSGSANSYVLAPIGSKKVPPAYFVGMRIRFSPTNANTAAATVNVNSLGAVSIVRQDGTTATQAGDLLAGEMYTLVYDGTNFRAIDTAIPASRLTGLYRSKYQVFETSGTFTVPKGVTSVHAIIIGAGGSGGDGGDMAGGYGGGGGGGAGYMVRSDIAVTELADMSVVVGVGSVGYDGGSSSFGGITAAGGLKGSDAGHASYNGADGGVGLSGGGGGGGGGGVGGDGANGGDGGNMTTGVAGSDGAGGTGGLAGSGLFTSVDIAKIMGLGTASAGKGGNAVTGNLRGAGGGGGAGIKILSYLGNGGAGGNIGEVSYAGSTPAGGGGGGSSASAGAKGGNGLVIIIY